MKNAATILRFLGITGALMALCVLTPLPVGATDDPVLYLSFDETSGSTCFDHSGFGHHGTMENFTTTSLVAAGERSGRCRDGISSNCLVLDGVQDQVSVSNDPHFNLHTSFTLSAWLCLKPDWIEGAATIMSKGNPYVAGGAWNFFYYSTGGGYVHYLRDDGDTVYSADGWAFAIRDRWFHWCFVFDAVTTPGKAVGIIYADGVVQEVKNYTTPDGLTGVYRSSAPIQIGDLNGSMYSGWHGYIDEVKIWDRALSRSEVLTETNRCGVTTPTLETCGTFECMGVMVRLSPLHDPEEDSTATLEYRKDDGTTTWTTGFPLTRTHDGVGTNHVYYQIGSLFWLDQATTYDVRVILHDRTPSTSYSIDGMVLTTSGTTRAEADVATPTITRSIYVSPTGNDVWEGTTITRPVRTVAHAVTLARPGDEVVLREGTYYEGGINITSSGLAGKPIWIHGYRSETATLDGRYPTTFTWTATSMPGVYRTTLPFQGTELVVHSNKRLFNYYTLPELQDLTHISGSTRDYYGVSGFVAPQTTTTAYIHLLGDVNPNTTAVWVSQRVYGFHCSDVNHIVFSNLTFRFYGGAAEDQIAIHFNESSDCVVRGCAFFMNDIAVKIGNVCDRLLIEDCSMSDASFDGNWTFDMMKDSNLESGQISVSSPYNGRGLVVRRNKISNTFDGAHLANTSGTPYHRSLTSETDFYRNTVDRCLDDGIENDGTSSNNRIFENTFSNTGKGISFAPVYCGPIWALYNTFYHNTDTGRCGDVNMRVWKFNLGGNTGPPGAVYAFHNTAFVPRPIYYSSPYAFRPCYFRNNVYCGYRAYDWMSDAQILWVLTPNPYINWDYDNCWSSVGGMFGWWGNPPAGQQDTFDDWRTASQQEVHGMSQDPGFADAATHNFSLLDGSPCIDKGIVLHGINDVGPHTYQGVAPDLGAFEGIAPDPPVLDDLTSITKGTSNLLSWNAVADATHYFLDWSTTQTFSTAEGESGWISATSYPVTGLADDGLYYYRVKCRNANYLQSRWSNVVSSTQDGQPPQTEVLDLLLFQWNADFDIPTTGSDAVSGISSIRLFYRRETTGTLVQYGGTYPAGATIHFDSTLTGGDGHYYFYTVGIDNVGNEETSPTVPDAATTVLTTNPVPPTLDAEPPYTSGTANVIYWTKSVGAVECWLEWGTDPSFATTVGNSGWTTATRYTATNLTHGQIYYYRAKSRNGVMEESDWSDIMHSTQDALPPQTIAGPLPAYQGTVRFSVPWSGGDPVSGLKSVKLFYARQPAGPYRQYGGSYQASPISFDSSLTGRDGTYYFYTVGIDNVGNEETSPTVPDASTTVDTRVPSAPFASLQPDFKNGTNNFSRGTSNTIGWTRPTSGSVGGYLVEWATNVAFQNPLNSGWLPPTQYTYTVRGLSDGRIYYYRVRARNLANVVGLVSNTVSSRQDASQPISQIPQINAMPQSFVTHSSIFTLRCEAIDAVSGPRRVWLCYRPSGATTYQQWPTPFVRQGSDFFVVFDAGRAGGSGLYEFCSITEDNVGNVEEEPETPDAYLFVYPFGPSGVTRWLLYR